jgi:hypothetical protein
MYFVSAYTLSGAIGASSVTGTAGGVPLTEQLDGELKIGEGPGSSFLVSFTPST